jgi:hypothetical protein
VLGRFYDKGYESGAAARGTLLRLEDQRRWPRASRRDVTELTGDYVRGQFQRRFYPLWKASKGVTVGGVLVLAQKLLELQEAGDVTPRQAERLAGFLVLEQAQASRVSRATTFRRQAEVGELGLVLADGVLEEVEVDLHAVMEEALDGAVWGEG